MSVLDIAEGIVPDLLTLEEGIIVYDSFIKKNVYLVAPIICALCDNARASELTNHMGSRTFRYCRICMVR